MWGYPRGFAYYKSPEKDFRTKQSKKFREEHGTITRRYIYGSTTQYAGNERKQNAWSNNKCTVKGNRETFIRLQNQPCSR